MAAGGGRTVLGLDEAGRGSLVGPLVVGGFLTLESRIPALVAAGARDSKALSPSARERVYPALLRLGRARSIALSPTEVDRHVRHHGLNRLEAEAFARLVRSCDPDLTWVDACDPDARRFGALVAGLADARGPVVARHKADRDLPVVGAASIIAKVRRDRAIRRLAVELGAEVGSGYPSDTTTVAFVRAALRDRPPAPPWLRTSWSTMQRVIPRRPARRLEEFADGR